MPEEIEVGDRMAAILAELVGDAVRASGDDQALSDAQAVVMEWEALREGRATWQAKIAANGSSDDATLLGSL